MFSAIVSMLEQLFFLISYVANGNSFPKPLSKSDELLYLTRFKAGDIASRNLLIEHNLRLVAHIAKKYTSAAHDSEDLISVGTIGLMKGIESYNLEKGSKLSTYISRCVENEILMLLRAGKKNQNDISLSESIGSDKDGSPISLIDVLSTDEKEFFECIELKEQVKTLYEGIIGELDEREREIIIKRYGLLNQDSKTQREIATELKISRSYISRIEKKALSKLKKRFEKV